MSTESKKNDFVPTNSMVNSMLTDLYQITMAYGYWHSGCHKSPSVFDLFFRKNPFKGEFTIFCGLDECLRFISDFKFTEADIKFLKNYFPKWKPGFFDYLAELDCSQVKVYAIKEGSVVFPREPLLRVEGPLGICQLLETTLLNCVNFPSLVATNAARHRLACGPNKTLLEFGLRRAQGPDGAMSASRYSYVGGFDGTSNVKAAMDFGIPMKGTHAHSFVVSFTSLSDLDTPMLKSQDGQDVNFVEMVTSFRKKLDSSACNDGELAAFIAYCQAYPTGFLGLIDTYDTLSSGLINFLSVALALDKIGYKARGVRLDSGDLAYLSKQCRAKFIEVGDQFNIPYFKTLNIVASNDLSEKVILSLNEQKHEIDSFGIGTNLVTCKGQPALGCVYKLVEINGKARIKLSEEVAKVTIPGRKEAYRLFNSADQPLLDLLTIMGTAAPAPKKKVLCYHPFTPNKRVYVTPSRVESLHVLVWDGKLVVPLPSLEEIRQRVMKQLTTLRGDHLRVVNPTPYKLSLTHDLYDFMHRLLEAETPIRHIE